MTRICGTGQPACEPRQVPPLLSGLNPPPSRTPDLQPERAVKSRRDEEVELREPRLVLGGPLFHKGLALETRPRGIILPRRKRRRKKETSLGREPHPTGALRRLPTLTRAGPSLEDYRKSRAPLQSAEGSHRLRARVQIRFVQEPHAAVRLEDPSWMRLPWKPRQA